VDLAFNQPEADDVNRLAHSCPFLSAIVFVPAIASSIISTFDSWRVVSDLLSLIGLLLSLSDTLCREHLAAVAAR
jgi:hypothetical protein